MGGKGAEANPMAVQQLVRALDDPDPEVCHPEITCIALATQVPYLMRLSPPSIVLLLAESPIMCVSLCVTLGVCVGRGR